PAPAHELVQPAETGDALRGGPQHQVISVAEDDVGTRRLELFDIHGPHGRRGAHRHERRRTDYAAWRGDLAEAGSAVGAEQGEGEFGAHVPQASPPSRPPVIPDGGM